MTHTLGPWWALVSDFAGVGAKREIDGAREDCWIVPPGFLFDEKNPPTRDELHANARLIAKAWLIPELVAACELAIATLRHHKADLSYLGELSAVRDLEAVLDKVKGGEG
jgi:hypothetical protein